VHLNYFVPSQALPTQITITAIVYATAVTGVCFNISECLIKFLNDDDDDDDDDDDGNDNGDDDDNTFL
jgi:hypothetical protein